MPIYSFSILVVCNMYTSWFYIHQTTLRELTTLGIKNAENLAIPSVRNDVSSSLTSLHLVCYLLEFLVLRWQIVGASKDISD